MFSRRKRITVRLWLVLVREDVGTAANTQLFEQIFQFVNFSLAIPTTICRSTKITKLVETMLERSQETTSRLRASALKEMKALKAQIHLLLNPAVSRYRPTVPYSFLEGRENVIWKYIRIALKSK